MGILPTRGVWLPGGVCLWGGGGVGQTPRTRKADSAHPTGMLSLEFRVFSGLSWWLGCSRDQSGISQGPVGWSDWDYNYWLLNCIDPGWASNRDRWLKIRDSRRVMKGDQHSRTFFLKQHKVQCESVLVFNQCLSAAISVHQSSVLPSLHTMLITEQSFRK